MSEPGPLSFHVPAPAVRPGGTPDFSDVPISLAGEVRRPPVDCAPADIRDLAFSIIRVLDRESNAVGPWAGLLSDTELLEGLRHMMTLRAFDAHTGALAPHFAYGALDKPDYLRAHLMHLANHWQEMAA